MLIKNIHKSQKKKKRPNIRRHDISEKDLSCVDKRASPSIFNVHLRALYMNWARACNNRSMPRLPPWRRKWKHILWAALFLFLSLPFLSISSFIPSPILEIYSIYGHHSTLNRLFVSLYSQKNLLRFVFLFWVSFNLHDHNFSLLSRYE